MGRNQFILFILLFISFSAEANQQQEPYMIDAETVQRTMRTKPGSFYLIDVRSPSEKKAMGGTTIPGTHKWMPMDDSRANDPKYWDEYEGKLLKITGGNKEAHIVLYCFFQVHSYPIGTILMHRGFPNIYSMINGINGWYSLSQQ